MERSALPEYWVEARRVDAYYSIAATTAAEIMTGISTCPVGGQR
jgi:hypothetical protein